LVVEKVRFVVCSLFAIFLSFVAIFLSKTSGVTSLGVAIFSFSICFTLLEILSLFEDVQFF
jgi:hypothetical protein